jgi:hypothetical protein
MGALSADSLTQLLDPSNLWLEWPGRGHLTDGHRMIWAEKGDRADPSARESHGGKCRYPITAPDADN